MCAEIIREFLEFYQMKHSLHVFVPEMSLSADFPKSKQEMEREIGIGDKDASKPLLLRLIEQVKFGGPVGGGQPASAFGGSSFEPKKDKVDILSFGQNQTSFGGSPESDMNSPETSSPDPTSKKEN